MDGYVVGWPEGVQQPPGVENMTMSQKIDCGLRAFKVVAERVSSTAHRFRAKSMKIVGMLTEEQTRKALDAARPSGL
jgi:hypothetical protein